MADTPHYQRLGTLPREGAAESGMIGILCKEEEKTVVAEFFELFKIPWEHCVHGKRYAAIICSDLDAWEEELFHHRLFIVFSSFLGTVDNQLGIRIHEKYDGTLLRSGNAEVPAYGSVTALRIDHGKGGGEPLVNISEDRGSAGIVVRMPSAVILRFGYDLFTEVRILLSEGQPPEKAHIPTLDLHIDFLRTWLVEQGVTLIEIPPTPHGFRYTACLTHDVDFVAIRNHLFDRAFFGFLYRASFGSIQKLLRREITLRQLATNWLAIASLPLVYLGLLKDFWNPFDWYVEIEKGSSSTFFIVPFKNLDGHGAGSNGGAQRRTKYDCDDVESMLLKLLENGKEIGVHGIDAWCDATRGAAELARLRRITRQERPGIRMHWLFFDSGSWRKLEMAGYRYDSTFGYNDAVGFRAGTMRAYAPLGAAAILELPLHIQDTALFYSRRLNLTKVEAGRRCTEVLGHARQLGGAVTILWHDRSAAPERQWGWLYEAILKDLRNDNAWITSAEKAVAWFEARRSVRFVDAQVSNEQVAVRLSRGQSVDPAMQICIFPGRPENEHSTSISSPTLHEYRGEELFVVKL